MDKLSLKQQNMYQNLIDSKGAKLWQSEGIIYAEYKENIVVNLEVAQQAIHDRLALSEGEMRPFLADVRNMKTVTKDARDYFASEEATQLLSASALLTDSAVSMFLGNFFLTINKPKLPMKLFQNKAKAEKWLEQYKANAIAA